MKKAAALFTASSRELKQVRTITVCAMMGAIGVVLGSLTIYITDTIRIGFSGLPMTLVCYLFGPVVGSMFAGALDILKYLVKPVGYFMPAFTLIMMLKGLIYGFFYYKKPLTFSRVLAVQLLTAVLCNLILNTLCLSLMYGKAFMVLLGPRIVKNLIVWPIDSLIFFNLVRVLELTGVFRILGKGRTAAAKNGKDQKGFSETH